MVEPQPPREVHRRLTILQHAEDVSGNVSMAAATTASASRSIPPGCAATGREHRQRLPSCPFDPATVTRSNWQTRAVITIRDRPTRPQRTGEAPTRLGVMPHQPERPGPSS